MNTLRAIFPGVCLALALALAARLVSQEIGSLLLQSASSPVSPVLCAVLTGIFWRNVIGVGRWAEQGLQWATARLLRIGIALVGLRLTFDGLAGVGAVALPVVVAGIAVVTATIFLIGRVLRIPAALQVLIGAGTAVCGCTAIVATAPVIRARPAETGLALSCIVLFGCLGMLIYPWVAHEVFGSTVAGAGVFLGTSIHDTSQVVGASLIYAQQFGAPDAVAIASATKFLRNISILVLVPLAAAWAQGRTDDACATAAAGAQGAVGGTGLEARGARRALNLLRRADIIPGFVVAFIALVAIRSLGDHAFAASARSHDAWTQVLSLAQASSEVLLVWGMTAIGLTISLSQMRHLGWRPIVAALITAVAAGLCSVGLTWCLV